METVGGFLCCGVALVLGFYAGWHWATGAGWAVLIGLLIGTVCVGLYFFATSWIGVIWPTILDARVLGLHLIGVGLASPACGALGSWLSYRRSVRGRLL